MSAAGYPRITDPRSFGRVAVLLGGRSAEREISLMTGNAVLDALQRRGVDARAVDPLDTQLRDIQGRFDRVWIALHGRGGEDGTVQGLLSLLDIPFTGSGVLGCALSMDKLRTKHLLSGAGIPTPEFATIRGPEDYGTVVDRLGLPVMVKPSAEGSSIGLSRVDTPEQLPAAFEKAAAQRCDVFAEQWVTGPEYTAAVLHGQVLPLIRIDVDNGFYDYQAKYFSETTRYVCPCGLPAADEARFAQLSAEAFAAVGAEGWGRVDFMVGEDGRALVLEVNTVPGMTSHSLVPMAARQAGMDFDELVWRILETSFRDGGDAHGA